MSEKENNEQAEREKLNEEARTDLLDRQKSNSSSYDKAILTLSTGALGFSLAFLKDIPNPIHIWLLITSWCLFGGSVVLTIFSFIASQYAITVQIKRAADYYLKKLDYNKKRCLSAILVDILNIGSGIVFIVAMVLTICFISLNIKGDGDMAKEKKGQPIPDIQRISGDGMRQDGQVIPDLRPVIAPKPQVSVGQSEGDQPQSGGSQGKSDKSGK